MTLPHPSGPSNAHMPVLPFSLNLAWERRDNMAALACNNGLCLNRLNFVVNADLYPSCRQHYVSFGYTICCVSKEFWQVVHDKWSEHQLQQNRMQQTSCKPFRRDRAVCMWKVMAWYKVKSVVSPPISHCIYPHAPRQANPLQHTWWCRPRDIQESWGGSEENNCHGWWDRQNRPRELHINCALDVFTSY